LINAAGGFAGGLKSGPTAHAASATAAKNKTSDFITAAMSAILFM
jgi:hypothetical protein